MGTNFLYTQAKNPDGRKKRTCISVGLLQPYIMGSLMNCETLYIADTNFRILKAHLEIIAQMRSGKYTTVDEIIQELPLKYATESKSSSTNGNYSLTLKEICTPAHEARCRYFLNSFARQIHHIKKIRLLLAPLEEIPKMLDASDGTRTFYLSNAIDPQFMSTQAVQKFVSALAQSGGAQAIYHQSTRSNFAIYDVATDGAVTTECADAFISFVPGHYSADRCKYYAAKSTLFTTYFDVKSRSRNAPKCSR